MIRGRLIKGRLMFTSLVLMVLLLVGCGGGMKDKTHHEPMRYVGQVMDRLLDEAERVHEVTGLVPTNLWGRIQPSAYSYGFSTGKLSRFFDLQAGNEYVFIAAGDEDVHQLFITIVGNGRSILAGDAGSEGSALVFYRPDTTQEVLVEAVNASRSSTQLGVSTDRPGYFAVMMLERHADHPANPVGQVRNVWDATQQAYLDAEQTHGELWFSQAVGQLLVGSLVPAGSRRLVTHYNPYGEWLGGPLGSLGFLVLANSSDNVDSMTLRVHESSERGMTFSNLADSERIAESSGANPVVSFDSKARQHYAVEYGSTSASGPGFIMYLLLRR